MDMRSSMRPPWVWTALALQFVLVLLSVYGCIQALLFLSRYATSGMGAQLLFREFIPGGAAAVSLIGLWRNRRWGWGLALIVDGAMCAQFLWFLLNYSTAVTRHPAISAFNIWQFAALAVLLYRPVWEHFLGQHTRNQTLLARAGKPLRWVVYFSTAVLSTCIVTAFFFTVFMGQKNAGNGGIRGFAVFLYFGLMTGCVASFLFALILTFLARKLGPTRLWPWLLLGAALAPALILVLGIIGNRGPGPLNVAFWGAQALVQVWWLTPLAGIFTGWICYVMYPWCVSTPGR